MGPLTVKSKTIKFLCWNVQSVQVEEERTRDGWEMVLLYWLPSKVLLHTRTVNLTNLPGHSQDQLVIISFSSLQYSINYKAYEDFLYKGKPKHHLSVLVTFSSLFVRVASRGLSGHYIRLYSYTSNLTPYSKMEKRIMITFIGEKLALPEFWWYL